MSLLTARWGAVAATRRRQGTSTPVTYTPTIIPLSSPEIGNTGRGQYIWNGDAPDPAGWPERDIYYRGEISWARDLELSQGVYTTGIIDTGLAASHSLGGRFGFRIMPVQGATSYVPTWLPVQGATTVPDWNSTAYLNAYVNLMTHLGSLYDSDPRLAFVDMGGYGNYGEWHISGLSGAALTTGSAQIIIDAVCAAFPSKHVLMMTANATFLQMGMNKNNRVGVRVDCVGATGFTGSTIDSVSDALARWQTAPFVGEWCDSGNGAPSMSALCDTQVSQYHISMLSNGNYPVPYASQSGADKVSFLHANKSMGYRINLTDVTIPGTVYQGTAFPVTSHWNNANVAPPYDNWTATYQLRLGSTVTWTGTSTLDPKTLMPGASTVVENFTVPGGVANNTYTLAVKIADPAASTYPMALAQSGLNGDGSYSLGPVIVGAAGSGGGGGASFISYSTYSASAQSNGTTATETITAPAAISVGNTLVVCLYDAVSTSSTNSWALAGWTFTPVTQGTGAGTMHIGIKTAASADTTASSYAFVGTSNTSIAWWVAGAILNYSGISTSSFSTTPSVVSVTTNATTVVAPAVSPAGATDLLLAFFGSFNGIAPSTTPVGMTARATVTNAGNESLIVLDQTLSASGSTGTRTQTYGTADKLVGSLVTISP